MNANRTINVLVVDDDVDDLYLINEALNDVQNVRYAITTATSSLAAMPLLAQTTYDVIFSDYRLGHLTGIDFIRHIRAAGIETPVILLTGIADALIDNAALKAGASDFVPKTSVNPDVLDRSVRYALAHSERQGLLQTVLRSTTSAIVVIDKDNKVSLWNPRYLELAKLAYGEDQGRFEKLADHIRQSPAKDIHIGQLIVEANTTDLPDGGVVMALHDVTVRVNELAEKERAEQAIRKVAMQDALTGLPNRMAFNEFLDGSIARAAAIDSHVALLSFDFNRFKEVNDLFGHAAGDHLLKITAERLTDLMTENEYAARLGGDEFVVVQEQSSPERALKLANDVAKCLSGVIEWELRIFESSVSVGVSLYPEQGATREELLANADLAMYRSKHDLSRNVSVYDASMDLFVRDRRKMAHDLKAALAGNKLTLNFQPQFNVVTGELAGVEALLRWRTDDGMMIPPSRFIPVAEENGLINDIDKWVLRRACEMAALWPRIPRIAVNISAKAISQAGISTMIRTIVMETGIAPSRLELEVTETALINDLNRALHNLRQIKALGIAIAMDDFGIGYSSLSLLNAFPFDRIKIDRSFIELAGNNSRADAIFQTIIGLGSALQVPVLAEGVETVEQLNIASKAGCEEVQGFLFGKPLSVAELTQFFDDHEDAVKLDAFRGWQLTHPQIALTA